MGVLAFERYDFRARMFYLISVDDGAMSEPDS